MKFNLSTLLLWFLIELLFRLDKLDSLIGGSNDFSKSDKVSTLHSTNSLRDAEPCYTYKDETYTTPVHKNVIQKTFVKDFVSCHEQNGPNVQHANGKCFVKRWVLHCNYNLDH